jgi:deoxyribonuclease (pyrimidine dimer)
MTRINSSIDVKRLTDEHLKAEHREIKRMVSTYLKRRSMKNGFNNLPNSFRLGEGHVLFFVDKGKFTFERYIQLYNECLNRGFNITDYSDNWKEYKTHFNDYTPTLEEHGLLIHRITERLLFSPKTYWHYYGKPISKEDSVKLLTQTN